MRTKRVNRYYCDFCKKGGQSKHCMKDHEERCTLNPGRTCRMCQRLVKDQTPMAEMLAVLPEWNDPQSPDDVPEINLPLLREKAGDCPVCIFAAIRQKKIPVSFVDGFDFNKEVASRWEEINEANSVF